MHIELIAISFVKLAHVNSLSSFTTYGLRGLVRDFVTTFST